MSEIPEEDRHDRQDHRHSRCVESRSTRTTLNRLPPGISVGEYSLSGVFIVKPSRFMVCWFFGICRISVPKYDQ